MSRIAIIPGDGIGIDVTREAVKVMATIQEQGIPLEMVEFDYGADKYLEIGITLLYVVRIFGTHLPNC